MKCIAAVVMVALAVAVQANGTTVYSVPQQTVVQQNVVPRYVAAYSAPAVTYGNHAALAYAAPLSYAAHTTVVQAPATYSAYSAPAVTYASHASLAHAAPVAYAAYNQIPVAYSAPTVYAPVQKEATYVAATRGAVHTAPLAGHSVNQKSLNVEPAPGTL